MILFTPISISLAFITPILTSLIVFASILTHCLSGLGVLHDSQPIDQPKDNSEVERNTTPAKEDPQGTPDVQNASSIGAALLTLRHSSFGDCCTKLEW